MPDDDSFIAALDYAQGTDVRDTISPLDSTTGIVHTESTIYPLQASDCNNPVFGAYDGGSMDECDETRYISNCSMSLYEKWGIDWAAQAHWWSKVYEMKKRLGEKVNERDSLPLPLGTILQSLPLGR